METKLNVWLSRDLALMGRTLLVKALGISKVVYSASMLCVPEEVIKRGQEKLFSFLWRNKKDKIERTVLHERPCGGGLNFPNVRTPVKALRLTSWIGRLLSEFNEPWKAIPNAYFNRYGGLQFLLKCNYHTKKLDNNISPFYLELLDYFSELRDQYRDDCFKGGLIDLSRIPLQCVRTTEPERGSGGHFHTFAVFLSTRTSTRCHCLLQCVKGLSYGKTKISLSRENLCTGKPGASMKYIL